MIPRTWQHRDKLLLLGETNGESLMLHPTAVAAWWGLVITLLNLL